MKDTSLSLTMVVALGVAPNAARNSEQFSGCTRGWLCGGSWRARGGTRVVGFEKNEITDWVAANWRCSKQSLVDRRMRPRVYYVYHSAALYSRNREPSTHPPHDAHPHIQNHISPGEVAGTRGRISRKGTKRARDPNSVIS